MAFAGVPNAKDRGDLIAYLKEAKWDLYRTLFRLPHFCVQEAWIDEFIATIHVSSMHVEVFMNDGLDQAAMR